MAQIPEVSGTIVFKKDGQPVVGALVSVLGTDISTITDVDGRFTLKRNPRKGTENTGKIHRYATQRRKNKTHNECYPRLREKTGILYTSRGWSQRIQS
ncbi:carboxypeptidase-like regulatory domain-containing protein [Bacteroides fragilis]|nr:carboxypeptidase-like regulatory domain-containing protein [Bacteroides fragilis]